MAKLEDCIEYVFRNEGGFVIDNGGPTKFGCTLKVISEFRDAPVTEQEVRDLTKEEATEIYRHLYWDKIGLEHITNDAIATCLLDVAINRGPSIAVKYAQRVLMALKGHLDVDGIIGPRTMAFINSVDPESFIRSYVVIALAGYNLILRNKPELRIYLKGWRNRANRLLTLIQS